MFQESNQTKAMVEVALALAMGFFSIMVLAMVSMSAGTGSPGGLSNFHKPLKVESQKHTEIKDDRAAAHKIKVKETDLIIWFENQFLDSNLKIINPGSWIKNKRAPILAVAPNTDLQHLLNIKEKLESDNITITSLNDEWLKRLKLANDRAPH